MELSKVQQDILARLRDAAETMRQREFIYVTEWLGYLPFGIYHKIELNGTDLSMVLPGGWQYSDIESLEDAGFIAMRSVWQDPDDEFHQKVTYAIA